MFSSSAINRFAYDGAILVPIAVTDWQDSVQTNGGGIATFNLTEGFIGMPRSINNIDGQVYQVSCIITGAEETKSHVRHSEQFLTSINPAAIKVFSNVSYTRPYSWVQDIEPIFSQYACCQHVQLSGCNVEG